MKQINVIPTSEAIDNIADMAEELARDLRLYATHMRNKKNPDYAADAINRVASFVTNCRLDLLISRPLREFMKEE